MSNICTFPPTTTVLSLSRSSSGQSVCLSRSHSHSAALRKLATPLTDETRVPVASSCSYGVVYRHGKHQWKAAWRFKLQWPLQNCAKTRKKSALILLQVKTVLEEKETPHRAWHGHWAARCHHAGGPPYQFRHLEHTEWDNLSLASAFLTRTQVKNHPRQ